MTTATRNIIRIVVGIVCLVIGVAGLVLPILPGWLFLAPGVFLLAPNVPIFQRLIRWMESRFPKFHRAMQKMEPRMKRWGLDPNGPEEAEAKAQAEAAAKREARRIQRESPTRFRPATSRSQ